MQNFISWNDLAMSILTVSDVQLTNRAKRLQSYLNSTWWEMPKHHGLN